MSSSYLARRLNKFYKRVVVLQFGQDVTRRRVLDATMTYDKYGEPTSAASGTYIDEVIKIAVFQPSFNDEWERVGGLADEKLDYLTFATAGDTDVRVEDKIYYGQHWYHIDVEKPYVVANGVFAKEFKALRDPRTTDERPYNKGLVG